MVDTCRSENLVYRGVEENDQDIEFLYSLSLDSESRINNNPILFKPSNKTYAQNHAKRLRDSLLGVIVCLPISPATGKPTSHDDPVSVLTPIGTLRLFFAGENLSHHRNANFGIFIAREYQRKGYGSETINWVLKWAFQIAGLHRVGLFCFSYNQAAKRLYERLGFMCEGRVRESLWYNGEWHDEIFLGMLESEWRSRLERGIIDSGSNIAATENCIKVQVIRPPQLQ